MPEQDSAFTSLMASLDPAMVVVTTAVAGDRAGCLVGFHSQSAIDPQRYCVWLSKANHTYRVALRSTHLGVHFLTDDDLDLAEHFGTLTGEEVDKFAGLTVHDGPGAVPLLDRCPNRIALRRTVLVDEGGDHVCLAAERLAAETTGRFRPLRLSRVAHLRPGHDAGERADPPTG
jgi:flavin reductase (DIM6/NTAB) family NADH-FMN oxidoreductase RutF